MDILTGYGICAGVGWLDVAVKLAWEYHGVRYRTLAFCERDAYAQNVLLARMEDSSLEQAAICDDMQDLVKAGIPVDCIAAGFPCQDISVAGKGVGIRGKRSGLWFDILDVAVSLGCRFLFLENVAAITGRGLDAVLRSLAEAGYDAEWMCLRASDVGAPHRRDRWFCVAHSRSGGCHKRWPKTARQQRKAEAGSDRDLGNAKSGGRKQEDRWKPGAKRQHYPTSDNLGNASGTRLEGSRSLSEGTNRRDARGTAQSAGGELFPPGPQGDWGGISGHLSPAIKPGVRQLVDGRALVVDTSRADQLRCAGNGVVVAQAAVAYAHLLGRLL